MSQRDTILNEIKDVPEDRLEELQQFIRTLLSQSPANDDRRKKILSFAGAFRDMNDLDFADFEAETKRMRADLFSRNIEI